MNDDYISIAMQAMQNVSQASMASAGMIQAADISARNRQFYSEEYEKQRQFLNDQAMNQMIFNRDERIMTQDWNKTMFDYAFDKQAQYNSPEHQLKLLVQAGINPNAIVGMLGGAATSGSVPASSPQSAGLPGSPSVTVPQMLNPAQAYSEIYNDMAIADNQRSQSSLNKSLAEKTDAETAGVLVDNQYKPFEKQSDLDHAYAEIDLMMKQGDLNDQQAKNLRDTLDSIVGLNYAQINKLMADASVANVEVGRVQETIKLLTEQIETEKHKQSQLDAAAFEAYQAGEEHKSAINVNGTLMSLNEAEEALKEAHTEEQRLKNKWREHCQSLGYDPDSKNLDRLIDGTGSSIRLLQGYGNRLVDGVKQKVHSISNFFSGTVLPSAKGAAQEVYSGYKDIKQHGTKWSMLWNQ